MRKLHPDEILESFSYKRDERPRFNVSLTEQYKMVSQTICLNVFEAVAAEALHAMGKTAPRAR